jgi:acyl carrier protein
MHIEQQLRNFIATNFLYGQEATMSADASLLEGGIVDSTGMLEMIAHLEETYGFSIDDDELVPENLDSIQNLVAFVQRKQQDTIANAG